MEIKFQCLGDLEITCGERVMPAGGPLQRGLLAMLLLNANLSISADRLIDALWDDPPDTALGQLQTRIWRLRQLLRAPAPGTSWSTPELITRPGGYALMVDPAAVDLLVFQQRIRDAESMLAGDRPREAALELRSALALFRGPAFANVTAVGVAGEVVAIEERRRAALEQIFDIELSLGMHAQLIAELREAVAANPYQERLRLHLMRALYRSGRRAEAVAAYREGHRTMVDGAGLEPSRELKDLHRRILLSDVPSAPAVASVAPVASTEAPPPAAPAGSWAPRSRDLPRDVTNLVGRCPEITQLTDYLSGPGQHLPRVVALSGMPGVGKTALAVRLAHTLAGAAPDGQLFAWLGGKSEPTEILHRFLRTLGVAESEVPATLAERSALFRACTAGRRLVLVLDDAHGEAQVRPLLPAGPATLTLVTSLRPLTALDGAQLRDLAPLEPSEAIRLLTELVGEERVRAEPAVPQRIAAWCEGLPLALRAAGARLRARPHWSLARYAATVEQRSQRLDALSFGDLDVRAAVATGYARLSPQAGRLFRALGALPGAEFTVGDAARLTGASSYLAAEVTEELVEARLVHPVARSTPTPILGGDDTLRYRIGELCRLVARERAALETAGGCHEDR